MIDLAATFEKFDDQFLKSDKVDLEPSGRADLHAFLLLDRLVPGADDAITCAQSDEIWLGFDCEELAEAATEDDILVLVRCGVIYDEDEKCLKMFT